VLLAVGAVVVDGAARAFVHRRGPDRTLFAGCWDIPGGHVEPGEEPLEALARELHEETGWRLASIVAELGEVVWTGDDGLERRELDYVVEVEGDLTAPQLELPHHVEHAWLALDEVDRVVERGLPEETMLRDLLVRGIEAAVGARSSHVSGPGPRTRPKAPGT
jgi:8-oxo-dGTP pyrophosphatase MutT (NUDIX family)